VKVSSLKQILRCDRERVLSIRGALEELQSVHVLHRLSHQRIPRVLGERDVAQQSRPVVLDLLGRCLRAGDARRWWNDDGMGVNPFQVECK
jgi:hypothetical protein